MNNSVIDALCRMPVIFKDTGETTMVALLTVSRYTRNSEITEEHIEAHLRQHPHLVTAWVDYSDEQRSLPAWYLMRPGAESSEWRVDYLAARELPQEHPFADEFAACAFFIMRKVEELSKLTG
jgi:hypothetical protein